MDFFRGEYVRAEQQCLRGCRVAGCRGRLCERRDRLQALARSGRFVERAEVSRTRPTDSFAFLKGTVTSADKTHCRVAYGIESWFVPRGKGGELEREGRRNDRQLIAEVRVDTQGHAVLKAVTVEAKRPTSTR